jgi:hypothetical protein
VKPDHEPLMPMTSWGDSDTELVAEFDALTRRAGIEVPADLKDGVLRGYRGLRGLTALLRAEAESAEPRSAAEAGSAGPRSAAEAGSAGPRSAAEAGSADG